MLTSGPWATTTDLLFANAHGRPVRSGVWRTAWCDATSCAECPGVRLHDLRHLAGTLTAQAGATVKETMARLGHSSTAASMRYQHVVDQRAAEVARRIEDLL
jgi:integrase